MTAQQLIDTVNKALEVYHNTGPEKYPQARALDRIEELTPPNSTERLSATNLLLYAIEEIERGA